MKLISFPAALVSMAVAIAGASTDRALAHASFDGPWTVLVITQRGACGSGSSFGLEIRDGAVHGYGGFDVRGRVAGNGAVQVRISSGDQSASGSGRLSGASGGGTWHGAGSRGTCSGQWSASRR
jgi:hypothetical protein